MQASYVALASNVQEQRVAQVASNLVPVPAIVEPRVEPAVSAQMPMQTQVSAKPMPPAALNSPKSEVDHETRKLEEARELLDKAQYAEALDVLARHQKDYPHSEFASIRRRYIVLAQEGQRQPDTAAANAP